MMKFFTFLLFATSQLFASWTRLETEEGRSSYVNSDLNSVLGYFELTRQPDDNFRMIFGFRSQRIRDERFSRSFLGVGGYSTILPITNGEGNLLGTFYGGIVVMSRGRVSNWLNQYRGNSNPPYGPLPMITVRPPEGELVESIRDRPVTAGNTVQANQGSRSGSPVRPPNVFERLSGSFYQ